MSGGRPRTVYPDQRTQPPAPVRDGTANLVDAALFRFATRSEAATIAAGADARRPRTTVAHDRHRSAAAIRRRGIGGVGAAIRWEATRAGRWTCQGVTDYGDMCAGPLGHEGGCW